MLPRSTCTAFIRHLRVPPSSSTTRGSRETRIPRIAAAAAAASAATTHRSFASRHPAHQHAAPTTSSASPSPTPRQSRAATHNPSTGLPLTRHTFKRRIDSGSKPWYITSTELQQIYHPFRTPHTRRPRTPIENRLPSPEYLVQQLKAEERNRTLYNFPRYIQPFETGDKIMVTVYVDLYKNKFERLTGIVLSRHGGHSVDAKFTIRNIRFDEAFEYTYPIHSPWIREIIVLEKTERHPRMKMYYIRDLTPQHYTVGLPTEIGLSQEEQEAQDRGAERLRLKQEAASSKKKKKK